MSNIKGKEVREFVWDVCGILAALDISETEPGSDCTEEELRDRYSIALLTNPSLFNLLDGRVLPSLPRQVVDFIETTIEAFGYIRCGSVRYIEALLMNPNLCKMATDGVGVVVKL